MTAEQLQEYVVKNNLEEHFEKLKQIDFFSKFLLLPNKKTSDASNQKMVKVAEEYEAIFFPSRSLTRYNARKHESMKKETVKKLKTWVEELFDKVGDDKTGNKLHDMLSLLFDSLTEQGSEQLLDIRKLERFLKDPKGFEKNLLQLIKFLTAEIFSERNKEFDSRLRLMIVLAIEIRKGFEVVKPVWVRRPADKWGSKFVLKKKSKSNEYEFWSILEGKDIPEDELKRSQTIGFNTHNARTKNNTDIKIKTFLGMYLLETPSLVGEQLDGVFDDEFEKSIEINNLTEKMENILKAMFEMFHSNARSNLEVLRKDDYLGVNCFSSLYPRLLHSDAQSKIHSILDRADRSLNKEEIFTHLVFNVVNAEDKRYYWAHCDEWGKNCFYDKDTKQMSWLDFEDSIFVAEGGSDDEIQFSGGRCWNRITSSNEESVPPQLPHINAISSLGRLVTASLQYYSVRDKYRKPKNRLSDKPKLCENVLEIILKDVGIWCEKYVEDHKGEISDPHLFPKKIKSQFLLACYDWAVHWDNHRRKTHPVKHRSWSEDDDNVVYDAFTEIIQNELENILCKPEDISQDKNAKSSTSDTKASIENKPSQVEENLNVEPSLKSHIKKHISDNKSYDVVVSNDFADKLKNENQVSDTSTFFESLKKRYVNNDLGNKQYDSKSGISKFKHKGCHIFSYEYKNQVTKQNITVLLDVLSDPSPEQEAMIYKENKNQLEQIKSSETSLPSLDDFSKQIRDVNKKIRDVNKEIREIKETLPKPLASVDSDYRRHLFNIEFQLGNSEEGLVDARSFAAYVNELSQDFDMSQSKLIFKDSLYELEKVLAKFQEFIIHDCDGGRKHPNQDIFTIYQQSEKMLIEFLFRIYEPKLELRRNMIEGIVRRSIIRRGILDLYLDGKISAECEAYFSAWTKRRKYIRWFWVIDDEAERNIMALIRYHNDKEQLEKIRRNLFKKRRGSNQYSRTFISLMDEFVDSKDRWNVVKFGLFEELVTWELDKRIFLK